MAGQDFDRIRGPLLEAVERLIVAEHAALHRDTLGEPWSPPAAYRWIRYEDPDPLARLREASTRLDAGWRGHEAMHARFRHTHHPDLTAVLSLARDLGFPK